MAFTKEELEALKSSLLASGQPIAAATHRELVQKVIDEMYSAQSRANVLAGAQTDAAAQTGDTVLLFRGGEAYLVPVSIFGAAAGALEGLADVVITDPQNEDILIYNALSSKWINVTFSGVFITQEQLDAAIAAITHGGLEGLEGVGPEYIHLNSTEYLNLLKLTTPKKLGDAFTYAAGQVGSWRGVAYANGLFVAVGTLTNYVMTSPDGVTWTLRTAAANNSWSSIAYGAGLFVAVAESGTSRVMTSPDGITWTLRTAAESNAWRAIVFANGLFVAVADSGTSRVMTSPDGITWTARTAAENNSWNGIAYGAGRFVAVAGDGTSRVMTSPDGITWTARTAALSIGWRAIAYGAGRFVAASTTGAGQRIMTSPDGITWTGRTAPVTTNFYLAIYAPGGFFLAGGSGSDVIVIKSADGITWTTVRNETKGRLLRSAAYGANRLLFISETGTDDKILYTDREPAFKHSDLDLDDGRNPHGTRYEDLEGVPPAPAAPVSAAEVFLQDGYYAASASTDTDAQIGDGRLMLVPFYPMLLSAGTKRATEVKFNLSSGVSSSFIRIGIYKLTSKTGATLVHDAGQISTGGGGLISITMNASLVKGALYFLAIKRDDGQGGVVFLKGYRGHSSLYVPVNGVTGWGAQDGQAYVLAGVGQGALSSTLTLPTNGTTAESNAFYKLKLED